MKAIDSFDMTTLDNNSQLNIKSINLMENAGREMANIIIDEYKPKNVLFILGTGGNAGDGLVCARYLNDKGINTSIYLTGEIKNKDSLINYDLYKGNIIQNLDDLSLFDIIVDAILGNGQKRPIMGDLSNIIDIINNSNKEIISLDMPTGINSFNGISLGNYIKPNMIITVEYPKLGLFLNDGMNTLTKLRTIKCGMDNPDKHNINLIDIIEKNDLKNIFNERLRNSNKSSYHRAAIIGGSKDYLGAPIISYSALSSLMMGVGYQYLCIPNVVSDIYKLRYPEIIVKDLSSIDGMIKFNKEEIDNIIKNSDSISIGMGMGISDELYKAISYLLNNYDKILIIDADGLNTIAKYGVEVLNNHKANVIITPHPKEFSRLSNKSVDEILNNPINITKEFAKKYNVVVILKGSSSVITDGDDVKINITGTTGLAKGGSGDALSGILAGISAYSNSCNLMNIASHGAYILGRAAEIASNDICDEAIRISDIVKYINNLIKEIKE